jgi:hypothetical protein
MKRALHADMPMNRDDQHTQRATESEPDVKAHTVEERPAMGGMLGGMASRIGAPLLQRKLQRRAAERAAAQRQPDPAQLHDAAASGVAGAGGALPHHDTIQRAFGRHDISQVRAHTDEHAADSARSIGAAAFATGDHVAFAGAPSLHTAAHEAAHVVQQRGGVQLYGGVGEVGDAHEGNADAVADAVVAGRSAEALLDPYSGASSGGGVQRQVQRKVGFEIESASWSTALARQDMTDHEKDPVAAGSTVTRDYQDHGQLKTGKRMGLSTEEEAEVKQLIKDGYWKEEDVANDDGHDVLTDKVQKLSRQEQTRLRELSNKWRITRKVGGTKAEYEGLKKKERAGELYDKSRPDQRPFEALRKKTALVEGNGFKLEADEQNGNGLSDMEFVTEPFDEMSGGAVANLGRTLQAITGVADRLVALSKQRPGGLIRAEELSEFGKATDRTVIMASQQSPIGGQMQASGGVRLDRVAALMENMGNLREKAISKDSGHIDEVKGRNDKNQAKGIRENDQQNANRQEGRRVLGNAIGRDTNANITGMAPSLARVAIKELDNKQVKSDGLIGLVALCVQYIGGAASQSGVSGYAKTIAPLMARTDFAAQFKLLPEAEQAALKGPDNSGQLFVKLVMAAVQKFNSKITADKDVFEKGIYRGDHQADDPVAQVLGGVTRQQWLSGIAKGTDLLTKANFPDPKHEGRGDHLESLGGFGDHTADISPTTPDAKVVKGGVFELRSMGGMGGDVPHPQWFGRAMSVVKYLHELNNGNEAYYKELLQGKDVATTDITDEVRKIIREMFG